MMVGFLLVFLGWISPHIDMNRPMIRRHLFEKFGHGKRKNEKTGKNKERRLICVSPHSSAFRAEEPPGAAPTCRIGHAAVFGVARAVLFPVDSRACNRHSIT
jgi:hypothetical protein